MDSVVEPLAKRFLASWGRDGRVKVMEEDLWGQICEARRTGDITDRMNQREVLHDILTHLCADGKVVLPVDPKAFDRTLRPPIPKWIKVVQPGKESPARDWQSRVWHKALLPVVADRKAMSQGQLQFLVALDEALKREGLLAQSGKRSRSLRLTGDEKVLEKLLKSELIQKISLEVLNVVDYPAPICAVRVGPGSRALVLENEEPFYAALEGLRSRPSGAGRIGVVAFGRGVEVPDSLRSLQWIMPGLEEVAYVGDLDMVGLWIMRRAVSAGPACGLRVVPATEVYQRMLKNAVALGAPLGWDTGQENKACPLSPAELLVGFAPDLADAITSLWASDRRIPEEVLSCTDFAELFG